MQPTKQSNYNCSISFPDKAGTQIFILQGTAAEPDTIRFTSTVQCLLWRYEGYSESKYRLRIPLAHPRDCPFAHVQ
jgi:hypothetical protein